MLKRPPDVLITTPESLYLMLTSSARETLRGVRWVIVDEIHAGSATTVLAATDPAQPFGAGLPWPEGPGRPSRQAGSFVVLVDGTIAAFLERGARSLLTFGVSADRWADALASLTKDGRLRKIDLTRIDGAPATESPFVDPLREAGFTDGYRGLTSRA